MQHCSQPAPSPHLICFMQKNQERNAGTKRRNYNLYNTFWLELKSRLWLIRTGMEKNFLGPKVQFLYVHWHHLLGLNLVNDQKDLLFHERHAEFCHIDDDWFSPVSSEAAIGSAEVPLLLPSSLAGIRFIKTIRDLWCLFFGSNIDFVYYSMALCRLCYNYWISVTSKLWSVYDTRVI